MLIFCVVDEGSRLMGRVCAKMRLGTGAIEDTVPWVFISLQSYVVLMSLLALGLSVRMGTFGKHHPYIQKWYRGVRCWMVRKRETTHRADEAGFTQPVNDVLVCNSDTLCPFLDTDSSPGLAFMPEPYNTQQGLSERIHEWPILEKKATKKPKNNLHLRKVLKRRFVIKPRPNHEVNTEQADLNIISREHHWRL